MRPVRVQALGGARLMLGGSFTAKRLNEIKKTQAILLEKARAMVVPGGRIIYITCSVLASEGPQLIKQFLANAPEIEIADIADIWAETIGKDGGGACPPIEDGLLQLCQGAMVLMVFYCRYAIKIALKTVGGL